MRENCHFVWNGLTPFCLFKRSNTHVFPFIPRALYSSIQWPHLSAGISPWKMLDLYPRPLTNQFGLLPTSYHIFKNRLLIKSGSKVTPCSYFDQFESSQLQYFCISKLVKCCIEVNMQPGILQITKYKFCTHGSVQLIWFLV